MALLASFDVLLVRAATRVLALRSGMGAGRALMALLAGLRVLVMAAAAGMFALVLLFLDAATGMLALGLGLGIRILMALLAGLYVLLMRAALSSRHITLLVAGMVAANSIHGRPQNAARQEWVPRELAKAGIANSPRGMVRLCLP
jgi:hypothetical protein